MAYTTESDLESAAGGRARYVELTDWDGDGAPDDADVALAQADADGVVDMHLRKFTPADLEALRATPTDSIKRIAAQETIYELRKKRGQVTQDDRDDHKERLLMLQDMCADRLRPADTKTARAVFIENDDDVSREGLKGMY